MDNHSGKRGSSFRAAVNATIARQQVLPVVGVINAYAAIMAERIGHRALYLSGGGVAAGSYGLPDLGITTLHDVLEDVRRITAATALPLLVDIDTGFGGAFSIGRCIREMIVAGASAVHIEDQQLQKRCGHRPNKALVGADEMVDRIKAAVDARTDDSFVIMARTDALANEGLDAAVERSLAYIDAGADMLFPEAIQTLEQYQRFIEAVNVPVLANITEFGKTPLFTQHELADVGVAMALYPLSAFRAMNKAAEAVYQTILTTGSQQEVVDTMQTRAELYDYLGYHAYEAKLDALFQADNSHKTR